MLVGSLVKHPPVPHCVHGLPDGPLLHFSLFRVIVDGLSFGGIVHCRALAGVMFKTELDAVIDDTFGSDKDLAAEGIDSQEGMDPVGNVGVEYLCAIEIQSPAARVFEKLIEYELAGGLLEGQLSLECPCGLVALVDDLNAQFGKPYFGIGLVSHFNYYIPSPPFLLYYPNLNITLCHPI